MHLPELDLVLKIPLSSRLHVDIIVGISARWHPDVQFGQERVVGQDGPEPLLLAGVPGCGRYGEFLQQGAVLQQKGAELVEFVEFLPGLQMECEMGEAREVL